jgi:hypothetical protein
MSTVVLHAKLIVIIQRDKLRKGGKGNSKVGKFGGRNLSSYPSRNTMNPACWQRESTFHEAKGNVKEMAGKFTDIKLEAKGKAEKIAAKSE